MHTGVCSADISKCKKRIRVAQWLSALFAIFLTMYMAALIFLPDTTNYIFTYGVNVSFGLFCTSVASFYVAWFFYPVDRPKSCCQRTRTMLLTWQTGLMAAILIITLVMSSIFWGLLYAYTVDGNSWLNASRIGHVGSHSFKVFHHYPDAKFIFTQYKLATADTYTTAGTTDRIGTIEVTGLTPATEYHYRVLVDDVVRVGDTKLVTAPVEGTPVKFTFTFGSCYMSQSMYGGVMWPLFRPGMMNFFERLCGLWLPDMTAKASNQNHV